MNTETTSALDTARADLEKKFADERAELDRKFTVLAMLPPGRVPIVCNWATPSLIEPRAWVCYSAPSYDPDNAFDPAALLREIEARGWSLIPEASLVKWDNYRHGMEPSALAAASAVVRPRYKYTSGEAVAPYWVLPEQYTKPRFVCFMLAPAGQVYRLSVDVPTIGAYISARRIDGGRYQDWHFERGSAHLHTPAHWPLVSSYSRAFVDTEQGISGAAYFHVDNAQKTASEALAFLLQKSAV